MKIKNTGLKATLFLLQVFFGCCIAFAQTPNIKPQTTVINKNISPAAAEKLRTGGALKIKTTDLAAASINVTTVSCTDQFNGTIKIEGTVKNVGTADYLSGAGAQKILLWEVPSSGGAATIVAEKEFQNLATGAEVKVSFNKKWYRGEEFPPAYRLTISYNPDIQIDGNDNNNDSVSGNNILEKTGSYIGSMVHYSCH